MLDQIVAELRSKQATWALDALSSPGREAYDYGHAAGVLQGLKMAEEIIFNTLKGDEDRRNNW